ncbi:acetyl-CoA carboxylase biotin carboxyl carrier protein [Sporomusa sp.]|uniref:acetyl-CoA carboxylase biotin carboxyl carrier protein n=1 Tax=Sporomusa sp. TaxID=2078658 RepID=UPI002BF164CA|nr:acetyl-CoA carboxylase biotin carboxyl carrier protein [Sporomusa sp.]HWR45608.1 acetyl-CoA carboxylase biotin carboxyl carrier protein [Sporomusa sp.]
MLKIDEILEIIKAVNQSAINRFELEQGSTRLVIVKDGGVLSGKPALEQPGQTPAAALPVKVRQTESASVESEVKCHKIVAPMIGTFYAAPEPDAQPFVKVGQKVNADTIVCVLEAMKLFNEIEAGIKGEIIEVLAKDGEFVEYGQPLFVVREEMHD